jgi:uncharacterized protein GlcG (DUF336 family)
MEFDLTNPECFAKQDPHPVFKRLRAEDPIHWTAGRAYSTRQRARSRAAWGVLQLIPRIEGAMPKSYETLTLDDAKRMLSAAEAKAASLGLPYNIAVVDAGGHLLAFVRQDGALIGSIDLAIDKAVTARIFDKSTAELAHLAGPGEPLFGIDQSNAGKVVIFGGGIPVTLNGSIVGAVGASAGTVEQDIAVAEAAIAALTAFNASEGTRLT